MDSLQDLVGNRMPQEPPEIAAIKQYIHNTYQSDPRVSIKNNTIIVTVESGALANTLRFHIPALQSAAKTTKTILLRIA